MCNGLQDPIMCTINDFATSPPVFYACPSFSSILLRAARIISSLFLFNASARLTLSLAQPFRFFSSLALSTASFPFPFPSTLPCSPYLVIRSSTLGPFPLAVPFPLSVAPAVGEGSGFRPIG